MQLAILEAAVDQDGLLEKNFEQMMEYLNGVPQILQSGSSGIAPIEPEELLERARMISPKLDYNELQGYERVYVRTSEPVAGVFSIW